MMVLTMDFINHVIEESKFNSILINGSKYTYVRKFAPHLTLRWSKREMISSEYDGIQLRYGVIWL